jgi:Big-like domain-containing protein
MQTLKHWLLAAATLALCACSGSDNTIVKAPGSSTGGGAAATLTLLTSSPQIPSDGSASVTITALVRDATNNVVPGQSVVFTATSGALVAANPPTTDDNGVVTATLSTAGDPTNRSITVTGMSGTAQSTITVNVSGTALALNGPNSLPTGSTGKYNVVLTSAGGAGIPGKAVTITSSKNNGISQTPVITDATGSASFNLTANNNGVDTLTASALGISTPVSVNVSADAFAFTAPAVNTEVALGSPVSVTVNWKKSNAAVANSPVTFSTTRGTLSAGTANTNASGDATVTVTATNAGPGVVTATNTDGTSIQLNIEFVAITPATLDLQASPFTIAANTQSALTATVRDAAGNFVKNQTVNFVLTDVTGGSLSVAQAVTNSQGQAKTFYNASNATSAANGVRVDATVQGTAVTDFVQLTVAQRQVFISFGTGNEIEEPNQAQYKTQWVIQVTDSQGNGVSGADVSLSVLSRHYWEGTRVFSAGPPAFWSTPHVPAVGCPDEDVNHNGVLDTGEDLNGNGKIEAGNILTVVPETGTGSTATTDKNGFALFDVFYPQAYAYWLEVALTAKLAVQGTEFSETTVFVPDGSASDFTSQNNAPPGVVSPFGSDQNCATPPPPDGP